MNKSGLQFGHGYSAVESIGEEVKLPSDTGLQFGHGYSAVESCHTPDLSPDQRMLQFGHGYSAVESAIDFVKPVLGWHASIRPRLFSRGISLAESAENAAWGELQFGHGYSAVESSWLRPVLLSGAALQFGHGYSAVESIAKDPRWSAVRPGFNSATAIQPWNRKLPATCRRSPCRFNSATAIQPWNRRQAYRWARRHNSFNSATAIQPWNLIDERVAESTAIGFNSATAIQPWNPQHRLRSSPSRPELQFGHGYSAVESTGSGSVAFFADWLQFGHGYSAVESWLATIQLGWGLGFNSATAIQPWNLD